MRSQSSTINFFLPSFLPLFPLSPLPLPSLLFSFSSSSLSFLLFFSPLFLSLSQKYPSFVQGGFPKHVSAIAIEICKLAVWCLKNDNQISSTQSLWPIWGLLAGAGPISRLSPAHFSTHLITTTTKIM